jgi:hypothetical protein
MTVTLNEVALLALLESQEGPVGQEIQRRAELVAEAMRKDVSGYYPGIGVEDDVGVEMEGSTATVGLRNDPSGRHFTLGESKAERYARTGRFENTLNIARAGQ